MPGETELSFDELADDFAERFRRGERPSLSEYVDRHPQMEDRIRRLFPLISMMEEHQPDEGSSVASGGSSAATQPKSLGDFRILREVGRGGMGIVYEAEQESLGRRVALKVLPLSATLSHNHSQRFLREAKAAARLHHTNIVPVFGVGEQDGMHYYVMQFIHGCGMDIVIEELGELQSEGTRGESVRRRHSSPPDDFSAVDVAQTLIEGSATLAPHQKQDQKNLQPSTLSGSSIDSVVLPGKTTLNETSSKGSVYWKSVARIGVQIADAIDYAHGQGILHRDIKPSNLLLDTQGTVWVTDFGLAKSNDCDDLTHTGDVIGTLRYLPPERLQGRGDHRSDIYSLGLTLYELLTMQPAFGASDHNRLLQDIAQNDPPRPRKCNPEIPRDLETIVLKAIDRDPRRRYTSASEFGHDLNRFVSGQPIRARRIGAVERVVKLARRHPAVASLTVAMLTLLMVGSGGIFWQWREAESARAQADRIADSERIARMRAEQQEAIAVAATQQATRLAEDEREATAAAQRAQKAEMLAGQQLERQLAELNSEYGQRLLEQDDVFGSLVFFSQARELDALALLDHSDPARAERARLRLESHDTRMAALLARCPQLLQAWSAGALVRWVEFSPDGRRLVAAPSNGNVRVWDVTSGQPLTPLMVHPTHIWQARFSPDGQWIVTGCGDQKGRVWNAHSGELVCELSDQPAEGTAGIRCVAFSPDGRYVATGSLHGSARVWDPKTGEAVSPLLGQVTGEFINDIEFSPQSDRLLVAGANRLARIWNIDDGTLVGQPIEHNAAVRRASFSPDGRRVVTCWGNASRVWDTDSGSPMSPQMEHTDSVLVSCFSPDGTKVLTAGSDRRARIWNAETGESLVPPMMHFGSVSRAAFSPDGRYVLTGSSDKTACVWSVATGQRATPYLRHATNVYTVHFSPSGDQVATGTDAGIIRIWDLKTVARAARLTGRHRLASYSADGRFLITTREDHTVRVWHADSLALVGKPLPHQEVVESVELNSNGKQLLTLDSARVPRIWNVETGRAAVYSVGGQAKTDLTMFSPDGRFVLFVYDDRFNVHDLVTGRDVVANRSVNQRYWPIRDAVLSPHAKYVGASVPGLSGVWDVETGAWRFQLRGYGGAIAASPDGRWLALAGAKTPIYDTVTGDEVQAIEVASQAQSISFSPQSDRVLMIEPSGMVRVASVATEPSSHFVLKHPDVVHSAGFSRDGFRVVTACQDGVTRVWDARTGERLAPDFRYPEPAMHAEFDRSGDRILTRYADGVVEFWELPTGELRPNGPLDLLAEVLSMQRHTESGVQRLSATQFLDGWAKLPGAGVDRSARPWQARELANCESEEDWFAAEFHLSRMIAADATDGRLLLQRGGIRLRLGRADQARDDFASAVELGEIVVARHQLARAHLRLGELNRAAELLQQALALCRPSPLEQDENVDDSSPAEPAHNSRTGPLWLSLSMVQSVLDQPDEAADAYGHALRASGAIELDPTTVWSRRRRGVPTEFQLAWQEALDDLQQLSDDVPASQRFKFLGLASAALGDYSSAAAAFAKATELAPESPDVWTALARATCERVDQSLGHENALSAWTDVAAYCATSNSLAPGNWTNGYLEARAAMALGEWERVLDKTSQALEIEPEAFEAHFVRGVARRQLKRPEAVADFSRAMAHGANRAQMVYERGLAYLQMAEPLPAEQDFSEAIQLGWNVALARYYRAVALAQVNHTAEALAELDDAIQRDPVPEFHFFRGTLHLRQQQYPEAEEDLLTATRLSTFVTHGKHLPLKTRAYVYLVAAHAEQAQWDQALQGLAVLVKRPEYSRQALFQTAMIELAVGRFESYSERCAELVEMVDDAADPGAINQAGWICAVGPDAIDDYSELLRLLSDEAERQPDNYPLQNTLGGLLYRAGEYDAALRQLHKAILVDGGGTALDWVLLSMVHYQLGDKCQAAEWLRKTTEQLRGDAALAALPESALGWTQSLETELLLDEATQLLNDAD